MTSQMSSPPPRVRRRWWLLASIIIGIVLLGLASVGLFVRQTYAEQILPNIRIQGTPVGQLRPAEARTVLQQRYAAFFQAPVTFTLGEQQWTPDAAQIGLRLDIDGAIATAYAFGRDPERMVNVGEAREAFATGRDIPLTVELDAAQLASYLDRIAETVAVTPQDATLMIQDGQALRTQSRIGQELVTTGIIQDIQSRITTLTPQTVALTTRPIQPDRDDSYVTPLYNRLTQLLSVPVTLAVADTTRTWSPKDLGAMVRLAPPSAPSAGSTRSMSATLDLQPMRSWLEELAPQFQRESIEPQLRFVNGRVRITTPGTNGARLDPASVLPQIEAALWVGTPSIEVPLADVLPQIRPDTLASLGIVELVAEGRSDFSGSAPYRIQNIRAGAAQMNGVLIAPNAEFSFNTHVGAITAQNGFTEGYAILDGRTQLEWGGGVCQVSTTVFRAAFWAGVPIKERNQHSFRIRWYEVYEPIGMDAAIFTGAGGYDFRFVNDTGSWLLMQSSVDLKRSLLSVQLYGTKPDRKVIQTPPQISNDQPAPQEPRYVPDPDLPPGSIKQTDTKRGGMDVRIGRIVQQNGQVVYRDTFISRYRPWPDIFALGPGAVPPSTPTPPEATPAPVDVPASPAPETQNDLTPSPEATPTEEAPSPTPIPSLDVPPSDPVQTPQVP